MGEELVGGIVTDETRPDRELCTHGSDDGEPCWLPEGHAEPHDFTEPRRPESICCDAKWVSMTQAARTAALALPAPHPQGGTDRETLARVRRVLDDELANLADDGARLSHSVVRRIEATLAAAPAPTEGQS